MRMTTVYTWSPEQAEAVCQRFDAFRKGSAPDDVEHAFGRLKVIAWEKLTTNRVLAVLEGDESDMGIWNSYWQDVGDFGLTEPCFDMKDEQALDRITPLGFMRR